MRYLTKSRFKLARECPTKLFYTGKREYANRKLEDTFLAALADGGFQVGALAKSYFPGGVEVFSRDHEQALRETRELLERECVVIFEAAFKYENFFIRADIVEKRGDEIDLIEVKAKSCDFTDENGWLNQNGTIQSKWRSYVEDIAFQKYVVLNSNSRFGKVNAFLMLTDKNALCAVDGLNQKFRLVIGSDGSKNVEISPTLSAADLETKILRKISADQSCEKVFAAGVDGLTFEDAVAFFADRYERDEKIVSPPSGVCKTCEFRLAEGDVEGISKSGFRECWRNSLAWSDQDFEEGSVLDVWNFRKTDRLIAEGRIKASAISIADISPATDGKPGLSQSERQWLQVRKAQEADAAAWLDKESLKCEMESWSFPLHFIDFESSAPAIPFKRNRRPYEGIAFQFSHHTVAADGRVEHRGEFLEARPGSFPNYDFVRALKSQLETDEGSIFRFHNHENTYLNTIRRQLLSDAEEIPDREDLCEFIETITKSTEGSEKQWRGMRNMIDLHELVRRYYYDPATKGSNSIKHVLPAILNSSEFLREKYSAPIYGAVNGIRSCNFKNWRWVEFEDGKVCDPYKLLPKLFTDESEHDYELLVGEMEALNDGGAAMTAYCKLQFQEMSDYERTAIETALLKYCELDTLAMVMIYEGWRAMM